MLDKPKLTYYFNTLKFSSILYDKSESGEPYYLLDMLFDVIYIFRVKKINWLFLFFFLFFLIVLSPLPLLFLLLYIPSLVYLCIIITLSFFGKKERVILIFTFSDKFLTIRDIWLYPWYWAKITVYGLICFKKKKINLNILDQMLLSKLLGSPLWIIKMAFSLSLVLLEVIRTGGFERKSIRLWPVILGKKIKQGLSLIIEKKLIFRHEVHKKNKIIVSYKKIIANQANLQKLFEYQNVAFSGTRFFKPYIIKLGGVFHQAFLTSPNSFIVFTSNSKVRVYDPVIKELVNIQSHCFWLGQEKQFLTKSWVDLENTENAEGYLESFFRNHGLESDEELAGFHARVGIINHFYRFDYFLYQSRNNYLLYKFPGERKLFGGIIDQTFREMREAEIKMLLFGIPISHRAPNKVYGLNGPVFAKFSNAVFEAARQNENLCMREICISPEVINRGLGEMFHTDNRTLLQDLREGGGKASFELLMKSVENSYKRDSLL